MRSYIDFINVGFGESTLLHLVQKDTVYNILIDTGSNQEQYFQRDERRIKAVDYLRLQQINRIDKLIITHYHEDHLGGLLSCLVNITIGEVLFHIKPQETLFQASEKHIAASFTLFNEVITALELQSISYCFIAPSTDARTDSYIFGDFRLIFLFPEVAQMSDFYRQIKENIDIADKQMNRISLALLLQYMDNNVCLLPADLSLSDLTHHKEIHQFCPVLLAPHHGDTHYLDKEILHQIAPKYVIVSADSEGTYDLPSKDFESYILSNINTKVHYSETTSSTHQGIRYDIEKNILSLTRRL